MKDFIVPIVSAIFGGAITAFFNYRGKALGAFTNREDIYADHTEDLFKRLDNLTEERDELKSQNIELTSQVKQLRTQTKQLTEQVKTLTKQVESLKKIIKGSNNNGNH
ncbi:hypothetical protein [Limosilactobacillus vaginalis]|uniref:hypothetical protein n=1 Tax=Limosilactobacillus vaginalis TaxID=1633 RepID=UPI0022E669FC|nr:hypothetical protein [Limosilactobacillus vaginalis]